MPAKPDWSGGVGGLGPGFVVSGVQRCPFLCAGLCIHSAPSPPVRGGRKFARFPLLVHPSTRTPRGRVTTSFGGRVNPGFVRSVLAPDGSGRLRFGPRSARLPRSRVPAFRVSGRLGCPEVFFSEGRPQSSRSSRFPEVRYVLANTCAVMRTQDVQDKRGHTPLRMPVDQLSRSARDGPISALHGGRPARDESQGVVWFETTICAKARCM